jgi:hypothetical protein
MTSGRSVTIRLPESLLDGAMRAARSEEVTAAEFIRAALAARLAERAGSNDAAAELRGALRRELCAAADWVDLQRRLRARGFVLRERGAELWLSAWPVERPLLPLAVLGSTREDLTLRFRAPFPVHGPRAPARPVPFRRAVLWQAS